MFEALEEFLTCGHSYFPVSGLSQTLKHKSMKGQNGKSEYQMEFDVSIIALSLIDVCSIDGVGRLSLMLNTVDTLRNVACQT